MQSWFFNEMSTRNLQPDWWKTHDSAWVTYSNANQDPLQTYLDYREYIELFEIAEKLGFDGVMTNEHHQNWLCADPSPNLIVAALSQRLKTTRISILGNALPLHEDPLRLAEEAAMLDCLLGGRLIYGFVRGSQWEYYSHSNSTHPAFSRERFDEAHDLFLRACSEDGPFTFEGKYFRYRYVNIVPKPIQRPPPIWIPSGASVDTIDFCAKHKYTYCLTVRNLEGYREIFDLLRDMAWEKYGYKPHRSQFCILLPLYVSETDELAQEEAEKHLMYFFRNTLRFRKSFFDLPGYNMPHAQDYVKHPPTALNDPTNVRWEDLVEQRYMFAGSPESVAEQIEETQRYLDHGITIYYADFGTLPFDLCKKSLTLYAEEVMPRVRKLAPDCTSIPSPQMPESGKYISPVIPK